MIKLRRLSRRGTTWCYGGPDAAPVTTESGHGRRRARPPSPPRTLRAPPSHVGTVVSLSVIHKLAYLDMTRLSRATRRWSPQTSWPRGRCGVSPCQKRFDPGRKGPCEAATPPMLAWPPAKPPTLCCCRPDLQRRAPGSLEVGLTAFGQLGVCADVWVASSIVSGGGAGRCPWSA
jgi:hypothetical protein